jgi:hypothetical protein
MNKPKINFDTELDPRQNLPMAWAMKEIAEGMAERRALSAIHHTTRAIKYLNEFVNDIAGIPTLTDEEANTAIALHTYMRKGMDSHLGTMLWCMVNESRGSAIWYAFVKGLVANKGDFREGMEEAELAYRSGHETSEDLLMRCALWQWMDDYNACKVWKSIHGK